MSRNGRPSVTMAATIESIIQSSHAKVVTHGASQAGMQMKIHISTIVAKPMGMVPRKRELFGSWIITPQISGYSVYLSMEIVKAREKRMTFSTKKTTESQYSHSDLKGIVMRSVDTMPVPCLYSVRLISQQVESHSETSTHREGA
jgi:hypothetical protein